MASDKSINTQGDFIMFTKEELPAVLRWYGTMNIQSDTDAAFYKLVMKAFSCLPLGRKIIIDARYYEGRKWEQIAARCGIGITQCKKERDKALDVLLLKLNEQCNNAAVDFSRYALPQNEL